MGEANLFDFVTEKGQLIIGYYLESIGIIDPAVSTGHQADETKKTVSNFIFVLQPTSLGWCAMAFLDDSNGPHHSAKISN